MADEIDALAQMAMTKLGLRPTGKTMSDGTPSYTVALSPDGDILSSDARAKLARFKMLKEAGHACFCTRDDVKGLGRKCCITGLTLPLEDKATFESLGGDVATGEYRD